MGLTTQHKQAIVAAVEGAFKQLGSYTKVANKCGGIAVATISNNIVKEQNWHLVSDEMWTRVGKSLGVKFGRKWNVVETTNHKIMSSLFDMAREQSIWVPISDKAGSGKTASIVKYAQETTGVFVLQCEEWSRRTFLTHLARTLGVSLPSTYVTVDVIGSRVIELLKQRAASSLPLLVLDEADKLKPSALRWLIHLYNKLENEIGVVVCGTENLRKEIKAGVARAIKGYDELDSRLGRKFFSLLGATRADVESICQANGLTNQATVEKVWKEAAPVQRVHHGTYITVVEDMRRLKRLIEGEILLNNAL
jgi:hypothetical protein